MIAKWLNIHMLYKLTIDFNITLLHIYIILLGQ